MGEIAESTRHVFRRSSDHGRKESGDAGCEHGADGSRDLFVAGGWRVVIDTRDEIVEGNLYLLASGRIDAITFHEVTGLCTSFPQPVDAKSKKLHRKKAVEKGKRIANNAGVDGEGLIKQMQILRECGPGG